MNRHGASAERQGFVHEAATYGSDDDLIRLLVPFLHEGVARGEPTFLSVDPKTASMTARAAGDLEGVTVTSGSGPYRRPLATMPLLRKRYAGYVKEGARRIRIAGQVPNPGMRVSWEEWSRYEAAINRFFADLPVWAVCLYDSRRTPDDTLASVERTHPRLWDASRGHVENPRYVDPALSAAQFAQAGHDPAELEKPDVERIDPTPRAGRGEVGVLARNAGLDNDTVDGLKLAVTETLTNAIIHGRPPVTLRAWSASGRVVVSVHDHGSGPVDPFAGLLPAPEESASGHGLWVAHQVCAEVALRSTAEGFTVRLVAGTPFPALDGPADVLQ